MRFYNRDNVYDAIEGNDDDDVEDVAETLNNRDIRRGNNTGNNQSGSWNQSWCPPQYNPYPPCPPPWPTCPGKCFCPPTPPPPPKRRTNGAIIPFASGNTQVTLTTLATALPSIGYVSAIGFGDTQNGITIGVGGELSLSAGNMAFSVPRNGIITAISAFFTNTIPITVGTSVLQIVAQLYYAPMTSNVFLPLPGTRVNLTPTITGTIPAGTVFSGTARNLSVNVTRGTRLLLVFSLQVTGAPAVISTLTGNASAGVNIV